MRCTFVRAETRELKSCWVAGAKKAYDGGGATLSKAKKSIINQRGKSDAHIK